MVPLSEQQARGNIDVLLEAAGWHVCDASAANIHAACRRHPRISAARLWLRRLSAYVDGKAAGVIEAKKEGVTLTGAETQSDKYTKGLPAGLPRWSNPLPFAYQTTGIETRFTNGLDPVPRSRPVFAFHQPKLPDHLPEANCSDLVIIKTPRAVLPGFGAYYMNSVVETRVAAGKVGIALTHFNTQSVAELPLPIPPLTEQHRIVAELERRLSIIRETATQVESNLRRAEHLRASTLQQAFSGSCFS